MEQEHSHQQLEKWCSRKRWPSKAEPGCAAFAQEIEELGREVRASLEEWLNRSMTWHNGSASITYEHNDLDGSVNWTKYKLVPYDATSTPPIRGLDEGILLCIDRETFDLACFSDDDQRDSFPGLHPEAFIYEVGSGRRAYRSIVFPLAESQSERFDKLRRVGLGIQLIESRTG